MSAADNYRRFLMSDVWREKRRLVLERDRWRCAVCGSTDERLHVHHLRYGRKWGTEPLEDLVSVCSADHHALHTNSWAT